MVTSTVARCCYASWLLAQQATTPGIQKLDPPTRAVVLMALLGLVLLGITLVACVMIGGRWARNVSRRRPVASRVQANSGSETWRSELAKHVPEVATDETVIGDKGIEETRVERKS